MPPWLSNLPLQLKTLVHGRAIGASLARLARRWVSRLARQRRNSLSAVMGWTPPSSKRFCGAAVSSMRRALHEGQTARPLQENAIRQSCAQSTLTPHARAKKDYGVFVCGGIGPPVARSSHFPRCKTLLSHAKAQANPRLLPSPPSHAYAAPAPRKAPGIALDGLAPAQSTLLHLRDGEVVLYRRAASPVWQCRYKLQDTKA